MIHIVSVGDKLTEGLIGILQDMKLMYTVYDVVNAVDADTAQAVASADLSTWKNLGANDTVIIGNSIKRGHPWVEASLRDRRRLWSIPEWLDKHVLSSRKLIAVGGSNGKSSIAAMIAWVMQQSGEDVGYILGGLSEDLASPGNLGVSEWFVIEADVYDTAWFDNRSRFYWYWPTVAVISNIAYAHFDCYPDRKARVDAYNMWLQKLPVDGYVCVTKQLVEDNILKNVVGKAVILDDVKIETQGLSDWDYVHKDIDRFSFHGRVKGYYQAENIWTSVSVVALLGYDKKEALRKLQNFLGMARRMVWVQNIQGMDCYDDYAHHPEALAHVCRAFPKERLHLIIYPSNALLRHNIALESMDWGMARFIYILQHDNIPETLWDIYKQMACGFSTVEDVVDAVKNNMRPGDICITCSMDDMMFVHNALALGIGNV